MKAEDYQKPVGGLHINVRLGEKVTLKWGGQEIQIVVTETTRQFSKLTFKAPKDVVIDRPVRFVRDGS